MGVTLREMACFRLFHERLSHKTPQHVKILEFMLAKGHYFTLAEIAQSTQTPKKFTALILNQLNQNKLIEKEGCLYRCNGQAMKEVVGYA